MEHTALAGDVNKIFATLELASDDFLITKIAEATNLWRCIEPGVQRTTLR